MAIALIYMNFLVPVQTIRNKYPGGWEQCMQDYKQEIAIGRIWFDEYLFHDGAMDPRMIDGFIARWEERGFQIAKIVEEQSQWADMCCIEYLGHRMPDWLEIAPNGYSASLAGTPPGEVVTPDWMKRKIAESQRKAKL